MKVGELITALMAYPQDRTVVVDGRPLGLGCHISIEQV
jgi:hypothetical protein